MKYIRAAGRLLRRDILPCMAGTLLLLAVVGSVVGCFIGLAYLITVVLEYAFAATVSLEEALSFAVLIMFIGLFGLTVVAAAIDRYKEYLRDLE